MAGPCLDRTRGISYVERTLEVEHIGAVGTVRSAVEPERAGHLESRADHEDCALRFKMDASVTDSCKNCPGRSEFC